MSLVNFKVVASGTGLSYTWQRKSRQMRLNNTNRETNTTYPNLTINNECLANVGSAQYQNGNTISSNCVEWDGSITQT
jgi:hypothetical protein